MQKDIERLLAILAGDPSTETYDFVLKQLLDLYSALSIRSRAELGSPQRKSVI